MLKSVKLIKLEIAVTLGENMDREEIHVHVLSRPEIAKVSERKSREKYSSYVMVIPMPIAKEVELRNGDVVRCVAVGIDSVKKGFLCVKLE